MLRKCHRRDTISVQPIYMIDKAKARRKITPLSRLLRFFAFFAENARGRARGKNLRGARRVRDPIYPA
jgi:hypothetical protein